MTVSLVTYHPDLELLGRVLVALTEAADRAVAAGVVERVGLVLVDNGPGDHWCEALERLGRHWPQRLGEFLLLSGQGNVGYGGGHNLASFAAPGDYHLVLNPDVLMEPEALVEGVRLLLRRADVGLVVPLVIDDAGCTGHLCKQSPTVWDLFLRGFAPAALRRRFAARLARYTLADLPLERPVFGPPVVSGCFMLLRGATLRAVGGFDERFFLYFEDFDLSRRIARLSQVVLLPDMRIRHFGGGAARKGGAHIRMFVTSAWRYFGKHGWRWW
ncbi:glycosyltransferase family protein [Endothiovibrio diazotrophicus]